MDTLKQSLKIAIALVAFVVIALLVVPERPALLAGDANLRTQAPAVQPEPRAESDAEPPIVAQAEESAEREPEAETEGEEAPARTEADAAGQAAAPSAGQSHLERLREGAGAPSPVSQEPPADAPGQLEAAPPAEDAPQSDGASEPPASGGAGIDTLTRPAEPVQFRLLPSPAVSDSGTISAGNQVIRLAGIVPVPADERCADGAACGERAREAVEEWIAGRALLCALPENAEEQASAPCLMGEDDVGAWIVGNGWAEAAPGSRYVDAEAQARADGRGIWAYGER